MYEPHVRRLLHTSTARPTTRKSDVIDVIDVICATWYMGLTCDDSITQPAHAISHSTPHTRKSDVIDVRSLGQTYYLLMTKN